MKVIILDSLNNKRVAKIYFEKHEEDMIINKLKKAGFEIDKRKYLG